MKNELYLSGEVGYEITLNGVTDAFKANPEIKDVYINSVGGFVSDGIAIYNFLKDKDINTHGLGVVASIATIIFLAGKKRNIHSTDDFLIHYPMGGAIGTADEMQKAANELKKTQNKLADIYADETSLTKDEALDQMAKDETLASDWLKDKGFVNEIIKFKAVAKFNINKQKMNLNKEDKSWLDNQFAKMGKLFIKDATNKIVQDADGKDIDFYELEDDATIEVGAKARDEDGSDVSGDILMPSGETYVFESGALTEIKEKADDTEALKTEIEDLKTQLADAKAEKETEVTAVSDKLADIKTKFQDFKNELETKFEYKGKKKDKKETKRLKLRK